MSSLPENYDICLFFMGRLHNDARSLNIMRSLAGAKKEIACISFGSKSDKAEFSRYGIDFFYIDEPGNCRALKQWKYFNREAAKYLPKINASVYWAGDMYSLCPARKFKKKTGGKIFYDSREIYSALGPLHNSPLKQSIITKVEKKLVREVDSFVVSGDMDGQYLKKYFKTNKQFHTILNLPPFREKSNTNVIRKKFKIPDNVKIILYQGMILPGRGIIPALEALALLENFVLVLAGEGSFENEVRNYAGKLNVSKKVILAGSVPYDNLHNWTCSADIGLCFIEPVSFSYKMALPNKLFEYPMAGIPALVSDLPAMRKFIETTGTGIIIDHNAPAIDMACAIMELAMMKNSKEFQKKAEITSKEYSYENQAEKIIRIINNYG